MKTLESLRERLDEIERDNENAHRFVQDLLIRWEETGVVPTLSRKQFKWLNDLHIRYCL